MKAGEPQPVVTITVSLAGALVWAAVLGGVLLLAVIGVSCLVGR